MGRHAGDTLLGSYCADQMLTKACALPCSSQITQKLSMAGKSVRAQKVFALDYCASSFVTEGEVIRPRPRLHLCVMFVCVCVVCVRVLVCFPCS